MGKGGRSGGMGKGDEDMGRTSEEGKDVGRRRTGGGEMRGEGGRVGRGETRATREVGEKKSLGVTQSKPCFSSLPPNPLSSIAPGFFLSHTGAR